MDIVIILGAPGSGKGTVCAALADAGAYRHLSTGDCLRAAQKAGTAVGLEARAYMERGALVPDETMIRVVEEAVMEVPEDQRRFLLDGFPRTLPQADLLDRLIERAGGRIGAVIQLDAPRELLVSRLAGRRVCRRCGATYHVVNIPPQRPGQCDQCDGELIQRPDDNEQTVSNRLDVYDRQTAALLDRYQRQGGLHRIDSARPLEVIVAELRALLAPDAS